MKQKITDTILDICEKNAHRWGDTIVENTFEGQYDLYNTHDLILFNLQNNFYNMRFKFISKHIKTKSKIVEIGDVNGFNIKYFGGKHSLSINFKDYSEQINNDFKIIDVNEGINIIEHYDYGMMFQTLEHTHNPILILNNMLNVCDKGVFISIPHVKKTNVRLNMNGGHVFEFCFNDFKKICEYYKIKIIDYETVEVLKQNVLMKIFNLHGIMRKRQDDLFGIFKKFDIYYLTK